MLFEMEIIKSLTKGNWICVVINVDRAIKICMAEMIERSGTSSKKSRLWGLGGWYIDLSKIRSLKSNGEELFGIYSSFVVSFMQNHNSSLR